MTTAKEYQKIKANPEKYNQEKERIGAYIKNRYNTDPEYRKMILERNRASYQRRKEAKRGLSEVESENPN